MMTTLRNGAAAALLSLIAGCSTAHPGAGGNTEGFTETGQASFYADKFQGRQTASGALYKHDLYTAAHKTLPFGSTVRVTNTTNGKSVVVEVNDRGPFVKGRIIDLSKSAFKSIANTSLGLIDVKIEVLR
ncbi:septal ring lytic transglycosylase RlpA family protein [Marinobacter sp. chi1]|uniref:Endolytic peptidoglycan transglycosylase RlpA n=1 Tax=Marinobacter suaedae TaxID=3057675 RepID=A0ABT8VXS9_9GAMM|nr:septal ring lytic transglycosylase RlpA family protein [Marinobacter sp. chi1]MDO3720764.1 septal ring lytic transglycosylase RlpA family protein [Marinobacter sp. chi1]